MKRCVTKNVQLISSQLLSVEITQVDRYQELKDHLAVAHHPDLSFYLEKQKSTPLM